MRVTDLYQSKRPVISMEFFPPRDEKGVAAFTTTIQELAAAGPDYMTVTFGAGGSTRDGSYQTVRLLMKEQRQPTVAYIAGYGLGPEDLRTVLDNYKKLGVQTIFAVRGDKPQGDDFKPHPKSFGYASELIAFIKKHYDFTIGCAGYPEGHIEAQSLAKDIEFLKRKVDNGAEYIVSQYFYDNNYFFKYVEKCRAAGITVPVIPGIMPVYTLKMTQMLSKICGSTITAELQSKLDAVNATDKEAVLNLGIEYSLAQCKGLLKAGVAGLHFYTMNRAGSTMAILKALKSKK
ncbi:MAG: methylenetetrahydrofolate reductase [NAD(P)H] [Desulfobacteraceae bacterium]|nr:methylenetetrahydrofolate reductase [NAD(P)H] [Desulfobacteraceae bacterium]